MKSLSPPKMKISLVVTAPVQGFSQARPHARARGRVVRIAAQNDGFSAGENWLGRGKDCLFGFGFLLLDFYYLFIRPATHDAIVPISNFSKAFKVFGKVPRDFPLLGKSPAVVHTNDNVESSHSSSAQLTCFGKKELHPSKG